jgi:predicted SprT family Zn-dependent metalloprotease
MRITSRCRAYLEGREGRYHTYTCRECGKKFQAFLRYDMTLRRESRICPACAPDLEWETMPILRGNRHS